MNTITKITIASFYTTPRCSFWNHGYTSYQLTNLGLTPSAVLTSRNTRQSFATSTIMFRADRTFEVLETLRKVQKVLFNSGLEWEPDTIIHKDMLGRVVITAQGVTVASRHTQPNTVHVTSATLLRANDKVDQLSSPASILIDLQVTGTDDHFQVSAEQLCQLVTLLIDAQDLSDQYSRLDEETRKELI